MIKTGAERREYLRIDEEFPVLYRIISSSEGLKEAKMGWRLDIGGGGMKLLTKELIAVGTWIEVELSIKEESLLDSVVVTGEVVWSQEMDVNEDSKFIEGVAYIKIKDDERRKIIKYVNNLQRRAKKTDGDNILAD